MELFRFREILGTPHVNGDVRRDWIAQESSYGGSLPDDYKDVVSAYGPGCINDQLYLFHPRAVGGDEGLGLDLLWKQAARTYGELSRSNPEMYPYPVYPMKGGCVPVARSISGNYVFLMPPSEGTEEWCVAVDMGEWVVLEMSFTDFLWAALLEELPIPVIEGEPSFERVGIVEPY